MNVTRLRYLLRTYGDWAIPVVAVGMLVHTLKRRKLATFCVAASLGTACWVFAPRPLHQTVCSCAADAPQAATITEIGTLGGDISQPTGINSQGQVVGLSRDRNRQIRAFLWQQGKIADIGTLGGKQCIAMGLNDNGQIVGISEMAGGEEAHGFLWQKGKMTDIGDLGSGFSSAAAVNSQGVVAGTSENENEEPRAFVWQNGAMKDIGALPGCDWSFGYDINESGMTVGACVSGDFHAQAFQWQNGSMKQLPGLNNHDAAAVAINNRGRAIGASLLNGSETSPVRAVVWDGGKPRDLGVLSSFSDSLAFGQNNKGEVVGAVFNSQRGESEQYSILLGSHPLARPRLIAPDYVFDAVGENSAMLLQDDIDGPGGSTPAAQNQKIQAERIPHAFLWRDGKMIDLNTLLPRNSGWVLATADAINDRGQIVGLGIVKNQVRAYLLTP